MIDVESSTAAVVVRIHSSLLVVVQCEIFVERGLLSASHDARRQVRVVFG